MLLNQKNREKQQKRQIAHLRKLPNARRLIQKVSSVHVSLHPFQKLRLAQMCACYSLDRDLLEDLVYRKKQAGLRGTAIGVAYTGLSVRGVGGGDDIIYGENVNTAFNPLAKRKDKKKLQKIKEAKQNDPAAGEKDVSEATTTGETLGNGERFLIKDFQGVIRPGEMMLVLGRPGSGCQYLNVRKYRRLSQCTGTTFLKTLSGQTAGYAGVDGEVLYGDVSGRHHAATSKLMRCTVSLRQNAALREADHLQCRRRCPLSRSSRFADAQIRDSNEHAFASSS